jgi:hypothetical protein
MNPSNPLIMKRVAAKSAGRRVSRIAKNADDRRRVLVEACTPRVYPHSTIQVITVSSGVKSPRW